MATVSTAIDTPPPLIGLRTLWREFVRHTPIWFVYISAMGLLHGALSNYPQAGFDALGFSRLSLAPTIAFPMVWFALYFGLRIRNSTRIEHKWQGYVWLAFMCVGMPLITIFGHQSHPLSNQQLSTIYELSQFVIVGIFVIHIVFYRGWETLLMFFGVTFVYGLILENTGIAMGYFFEDSFSYYLGPLPAPMCTMVGWCVVFYATVAVVQHLTQWIPWLAKGVWRRALITTALALSLDAQLDPLASMSGVFWRWDATLTNHFFGVPVINFAAWFGAFLPFSYFAYKIMDRKEWTWQRRNYELLLRIPLAALSGGILCFAIMAAVEGGFDGPTFQIMGSFFDRLFPY